MISATEAPLAGPKYCKNNVLRVALDDFGPGYWSMNCLRQYAGE